MASILAAVRLIFLLSTLVAASVPFLLKFKGLLQHLCFIWALYSLDVNSPFRFTSLALLKFHTCQAA